MKTHLLILAIFFSACAAEVIDGTDVEGLEQDLTTTYNVINSNPNVNGQPGMRPLALATVTDRRMTSLRCDMMRHAGTTYLCVADGSLTFFCTRTGGAAAKNYFTEVPGGGGLAILQIFEAAGTTRAQGGSSNATMVIPNPGVTHITGTIVAGGTTACNIGAGGTSATYAVTQ